MTEINLQKSSRTVLWRLAWLATLAVAIALILGALSACQTAGTSSNINLNKNPPECTQDSDCTVSGEVCSPHQVCLPLATDAFPIALDLAPANEDDTRRLAQMEVPPLDLDYGNDGRLTIAYPEAVELHGAVMVVNDVQLPLQTTFTATRPSRIPGRPKVIISQSVMAEGFLMRPDPADVTPSVALKLPAGVTHTLRASPDAPYDQNYHPLMRDVTLQSDDEQWFMFGDPEQSIFVAGAVLDALGEPVEGARVKAVDEAQGLFVSSVGVTDETGTFHLLMPRGTRSYKLTIGPSSTNATVPEVVRSGLEIGATAAQQGVENAYDNPEELDIIRLPAFPDPLAFDFRLEGRGSDGVVHPATGVTATFETEVGSQTGVSGTYRVTATSDSNGELHVDLIPGNSGQNRSYTVTLVTPVETEDLNAEFASDVLEGDRALEVGAYGGTMTIELDRRLPFSSYVDSPLGLLSGLTVQTRRLDGAQSLRGTLRTDLTDEDGKFSLNLAPGQYNIEIIPPTGLPLPRWVVPEPLEVLPDEISAAFVSGITLPDAAVLEVKVVADNATADALPDIRVKVYLVDDFCATLNEVDYDTCDVDSVFLGEAVTDNAGQVRILVPRQQD